MRQGGHTSERAVPDAVRRALHGRYEVEREVGRGAMGTVYRARDRRTGRPVGIKVLEPGGAHPPDARERLFREARLMAALAHPNVLRIEDVDEVEGVVFQVREWVDGSSVEEILRERGRLELVDALALGIAVAGALEAAHAKGVVHRDLKPSNVLVPRKDGRLRFERARLLDFGVHGELGPVTGSTQAGELFGTPYYMAPEQITAGAQSPATDVYGLGVLLYEALVGKRPFEGSNLHQLMQAVVNEPVEFPPGAEVPPAVADFIRTCLEKDPERRPDRPLEALEALRATVAEGGGRSTGAAAATGAVGSRPAVPSRPKPAAPGSASAPATHSSTGRRGPPFRAVVAGGAAAVLLVAFVASVLASGGTLGPGVAQSGDLLLGAGLLVAGASLGFLVHAWLVRKGAGVQRRVAPILALGSSRDELSRSMAILVSDLVAQARKVDERVLGAGVALMVEQLQDADNFADRKEALLTAMDLMERLRERQTPWWVRHDKLVAMAVATAGILTGVVKIVEAFRGS